MRYRFHCARQRGRFLCIADFIHAEALALAKLTCCRLATMGQPMRTFANERSVQRPTATT